MVMNIQDLKSSAGCLFPWGNGFTINGVSFVVVAWTDVTPAFDRYNKLTCGFC